MRVLIPALILGIATSASACMVKMSISADTDDTPREELSGFEAAIGITDDDLWLVNCPAGEGHPCHIVFDDQAPYGWALDQIPGGTILKKSKGAKDMEATKVYEALQRATKEFGLCPNRVWAIGHSLEGWETKFPQLIPTSERSASMGIVSHEGHEQCTFDLCEYSLLNFTSVAQRHERASCLENPCKTLKGLFPRDRLDKASLAGRPTAWRLNGKSLVNHTQPYMAISHVWADGTGVGAWPDGEVNECLYRFFERIARRWQCAGIWWDTICIPKDKAARAKAILRMESNYDTARITLVHDAYLRKWKWVDAETACLAIILSPWFSRGWTALELARSSKVKVIFKGSVIKDLDEDILSKSDSDTPCHRLATEAIKGLRQKIIIDINDLLTVLGPRSTSWARDMAVISSILVGLQKFRGERQQDIYKQVLGRLNSVAHGHLFHGSATMTGHFSWCPTNLLDLPMVPITKESLYIESNGGLIGTWKVIKPESVPRERYVLHSGSPLMDIKVKVTLEAADKYVLLGEPDAELLTRSIAAKVLRTEHHEYEFIGPVYFSPPLALDEIQWETDDYVTIGARHEVRSSDKGTRSPRALPHLPTELKFLLPYESMPQAKENIYASMDMGHRLVLAAMEGDHDEINEVLKGSVDVNVQDSGGWTALHHAARRGHNVIIMKLLMKGADVTIQDKLGQQSLHLAAERAEYMTLVYHKKLMTGHQPCKKGQTALHRAVLADSPAVAAILLDGLKDVKDVQDLQGRTALHLCAELGVRKIFTLLLSRQANPLLKDSTGRTALHYAAMDWNDTPDIIPALLDYKGLNVPDDDGRMPLHYAADLGCPRYVKLLSQSTNLAIVDSWGQTAFHIAAHGGHLQAAEELLACNEQRRELTQSMMDAALHLAASVGNLQIVQALVDHGAGIWHRDSSGKTAVELAVELEKAPLTMYLVELVLSSSRARDLPPGWIEVATTCPLDDDPSALHHAMRRNYQNVALALIEDGEDIFKTDTTGKTCLSLAVDKLAKTVVRALVGKYADAIFTAKHLELEIRVMAAASNRPLDAYCYRDLEASWKDMLFDSWTAVMHLEEAFNSTNDPEMRRLLTPAWETMSWKVPTKPMALGMDLTPPTLHGMVIDRSGGGSVQLEDMSSFVSRRIHHRRHAGRGKSIYRRPAERQRSRDDDDDDDDDEEEEDEDDEDEDEGSDSVGW
ncbi:hypothetical protein CNMCM6106_003941 [Aspergillus hiratsukae]|uniref:Heterokaryon incompatibility domain-containing protein n=1 Tax=Aspergillus hiratsukae TaxID=1194566 RepID=A0A8H6UKK2_9EURO|nr:hypothetical protein CNMCM6106_003941 [Aspergillus hiratsukae]